MLGPDVIAGLALAGLPIALYALDNYHRVLNPAKDWWRYGPTLATIRDNVFIQQQQLQATFRTMGLQDPTLDELKEHLVTKYPDKYHEFISIFERMGRIVEELLDRLEGGCGRKGKV